MNRSLERDIFSPWIGKNCAEIIRYEYSWQFSFPPAGSVTVASIWRIVADARIALCSLDDGQRFGLPKHVDAAQGAWNLIFSKTITDVFLSVVGDLSIEFGKSLVLEILVNSSGYESWNAAVISGKHQKDIVATGGGNLAIFDLPSI